MTSPTYLTTTFKDREQVKALGARWDPEERRWFVPPGRDLAPFAHWLLDGGTNAVATAPSTALASGSCALAVQLSTAPKGVALSQLLGGVAQAVARAYGDGVWTRVEVVKADARRGHVYLELAERSADGTLVAQARGVIWADTANQVVPKFQQEVTVIGEVQNATSHLYRPELSRDDFVALSGGATRRADRNKIYVVRADGSVVANASSQWFRSGSRIHMQPGDTIVVPLDTERLPALPFWQAIAQIVANLAISAAAINSF